MDKNNDIFELMTKMYSEMQTGFSTVNSRIDNIETRFDTLETRFDTLETKVDNLETKVDKNSLLLEKLESNIKLLAEGQESFREQIGRTGNEDKRTITDRLEIIELATCDTSNDVKNISLTVDVLKAATGSNTIDITVLKQQRTSSHC